jgi:hypothetical protein
MVWVVEFDEEFSRWFESLDEGLQDELYGKLKLLAQFGPSLRRPNVGSIHVHAFRI